MKSIFQTIKYFFLQFQHIEHYILGLFKKKNNFHINTWLLLKIQIKNKNVKNEYNKYHKSIIK